ncbi:MAG: hypothetical protein OHK0046_49350 [Anaerolineae bacterium]
MNRQTNQPWLSYTVALVLAAVTFVGLVLNIPEGQTFSVYITQALVFGFLTTFVMLFGVYVSDTELSPVHAFGMVAFLAMPAAAFPLMLWIILMGSALGVLLLRHREKVKVSGWMQVARVTLSFMAAGLLYRATGAPLPLERFMWEEQFYTVLAIVIYVLVYVTLYFSIFVLELYMRGERIGAFISENVLLLMVILLLPVPFALISAEYIDELSRLSEVVSLVALVLIALGLHALSRSDRQLRKQVNELQTISVVTRTVRSHLELDTLLKTLYLQIAHLLSVENFTVALYNWSHSRLEYPLVMRRGREDTNEHDIRVRLYHNALIQHVFENHAPLLIGKHVPEAARALKIEVPANAMSSWVGVPLLAGGRSLGVIEVFSENPDHLFSEDDLRLLNIVIASASIAIENAQLYQQQTERLEQMSTLNNIAGLLTGTLSPETVLDTVISSASAIAQANAVAVYLFWDEAKENLPLVRCAGLTSRFTDNPPAPVLRQGDLAKLHLKLPLSIPNIHEDSRTSHLSGLMQHEHKVAIVELPLVIGEDSLGVLVLYFNQPQTFSGEQLELLRTFATQAAQAINNARTFTTTDEAFQRSVEQLFALAEIGRLLTSTIDLRKIAELVLSKAAEATRVDTGLVALYDQNEHVLRLMAHMGYPESALGESALAQMQALNGQVRRVNDTRKNPVELQLIDTMRSQLLVPIMRGRELLGYLLLESPKLAAFSAEDSNFITQITNQAIIAIDNARLFDRITEGRDRLQVILDTMEEGLILIDERGKIALANPRITMIGLEPERLIHNTVSDLLQDAQMELARRLGFERPDHLEKLVRRIMKDAWTDEDSHLYAFEGNLYIQRDIIPVPGEKGIMGALLVFYDKTEEQELNRAREELSRMIVHDLRSPLTAVTTSFKLLQELVPRDADFYPLVEKTSDASRRAIRKLLSRVDSLLDIAKMQSGRLGIDADLTEFEPLVENVITELTPLATELDIMLAAEIAPDVPVLNVDEDKIERLLLNLVDNALKYSPMDSTITIRAYPIMDGARSLLRVDVIDNGPGVPDDYKKTLFESFVQVEGRQKVRRGVGLGLSFCRLVAEAHGGRIWVEDNPGGGSIFAFTLPLIELESLTEDSDELSV